jgi:hypothetical protein
LEGDTLMKYQAYFRWRTDACRAITHPVIQPLYFVAHRRKIAEESIASGSKDRGQPVNAPSQNTVFLSSCAVV